MPKTYCVSVVEKCLLSNRVSDYPFISQGKTRIPGVNDNLDGEETDVSKLKQPLFTGSTLSKVHLM